MHNDPIVQETIPDGDREPGNKPGHIYLHHRT